jgi:hypothetical protein
MTESNYNSFVDRRNDQELLHGLATPILYWYDKDKKKRTRTNGITINMAGEMIIARSSCSKDDQFNRSTGRLKTSSRILGQARKHCWVLQTNISMTPEDFANAYLELFPNDDKGCRRAYNVGKIFSRYKEEIQRREKDLLDA